MAVALSLAENEEAREQKHRRSPGCSALVRDGIAQGRDFVPWWLHVRGECRLASGLPRVSSRGGLLLCYSTKPLRALDWRVLQRRSSIPATYAESWKLGRQPVSTGHEPSSSSTNPRGDRSASIRWSTLGGGATKRLGAASDRCLHRIETLRRHRRSLDLGSVDLAAVKDKNWSQCILQGEACEGINTRVWSVHVRPNSFPNFRLN